MSDKAIGARADTRYKIQVVEASLPPETRMPEAAIAAPQVIYVIEGTLTQRRGDQVTRVEAGTAIEGLVGTRLSNGNEGTTTLRILTVSLLPTPAPPAPPIRPPATGNAGMAAGSGPDWAMWGIGIGFALFALSGVGLVRRSYR